MIIIDYSYSIQSILDYDYNYLMLFSNFISFLSFLELNVIFKSFFKYWISNYCFKSIDYALDDDGHAHIPFQLPISTINHWKTMKTYSMGISSQQWHEIMQ